MQLAVVVPMYNEESGARRFIEEVACVLASLRSEATLVVVDDGSTDGTLLVLEAARSDGFDVDVVAKAHNAGYGAALRTGVERAYSVGAQWVLFMDSDLTNPPADILTLASRMAGAVDFVKACRYCSGGGMVGVPLGRRMFSRVGNVVARLLVGPPHRDPTNGFRAFRTDRYLELPGERFGVLGHPRGAAPRSACRPTWRGRSLDIDESSPRPSPDQLPVFARPDLGLSALAAEDSRRSAWFDATGATVMSGPGVLVLGRSGMVGSMLVRVLGDELGPRRGGRYSETSVI